MFAISELIPDQDGRSPSRGSSPLDTPEGRQWLLNLADQWKREPAEVRRVRLVRRLNRALVKKRARSTP